MTHFININYRNKQHVLIHRTIDHNIFIKQKGSILENRMTQILYIMILYNTISLTRVKYK